MNGERQDDTTQQPAEQPAPPAESVPTPVEPRPADVDRTAREIHENEQKG
jgi:hypothetical protein